MFKRLLIVLLAVVLGFVGYVAMQPPEGGVTRSLAIDAPPSAIFPHVNDLRKWEQWSPWAKLDPNAKVSFEGPDAGTGAVFNWSGTDEIGEGKMAIVESRPDEAVKLKMDFAKPFSGTSTAEFTFKPEGGKTLVTWDMRSERPFLTRLMCTLFRADATVGDMFAKGLANLAAVTTGKPG
ncbi:MAG: SRPBCC family protein [Hyphomicrobium sp.]